MSLMEAMLPHTARADEVCSVSSTTTSTTGAASITQVEPTTSWSSWKDSESGEAPVDEGTEEVKWLPIILKLLLSFALFGMFAHVLHRTVGHHVAIFATNLMGRCGFVGLFFADFFVELSGFPFVWLVFVAVEGGMNRYIVLATCAVGSYLASMVGYGLGTLLRRPGPRRERLDKWLLRYPKVVEMMQKRGAFGVALVAGILPIPLAIAAFMAGFFKVRFALFSLAVLCRWPKILAYVMLSPSPT